MRLQKVIKGINKKILLILTTVTVVIALSICVFAATSLKKNTVINDVPINDVAVSIGDTFEGSIILGRPENTQITASITANSETSVYVAWGEIPNSYNCKSKVLTSTNLVPTVIVMDKLNSNKQYYYRLYFKASSDAQYKSTKEYSFRTSRSSGDSYSFVVQSDSHLLNKADTDLYKKSMEAMASFKPDFMFDLGDTFLNDQVDIPNQQAYEKIRQNTFQQLSYFDIVTRNAPLFLTIGNHEGESGNYLNGTSNNLAAKSTKARTTYFPNPVPDSFYSGNSQAEEVSGLPQNYYAFTWGDALYVSIDPYRYSTMDPYTDKNGWAWTLGKTQYDWFRKTLEESKSKYKFVFSHHAIGNIRGGAEVAKLFEWGGYDQKGKYLFDKERPGWGKPIQQIMKDTGVTIFFQGHDHLFAREVVDGVVYQTIPKPAEKIADIQNNLDAYPKGDVLMNSGFLKINVSDSSIQVDFYRNFIVSSAPQSDNTGIVYSYTVDSNHNVKIIKSKTDDLTAYGKNQESIKKDTNKKQIKNNPKK